MGYSLYIKKNITLDSKDVQVKPEFDALLGNSNSITLSKVIFDLDGWDVCETFDSYRPEGNEIRLKDLREFLEDYFEGAFTSPILEDVGVDSHRLKNTFYTYFESY